MCASCHEFPVEFQRLSRQQAVGAVPELRPLQKVGLRLMVVESCSGIVDLIEHELVALFLILKDICVRCTGIVGSRYGCKQRARRILRIRSDGNRPCVRVGR